MQNNRKVGAELQGIDQALQRAAAKAKLQAERQGLPYVVSSEASSNQFVNKNKIEAKSK